MDTLEAVVTMAAFRDRTHVYLCSHTGMAREADSRHKRNIDTQMAACVDSVESAATVDAQECGHSLLQISTTANDQTERNIAGDPALEISFAHSSDVSDSDVSNENCSSGLPSSRRSA